MLAGDSMKNALCAALVFLGLLMMFIGLLIAASRLITAMLPLFDALGHSIDTQMPHGWLGLLAVLLLGGFGIATLGERLCANEEENNERTKSDPATTRGPVQDDAFSGEKDARGGCE
jgi:hypothetical protein